MKAIKYNLTPRDYQTGEPLNEELRKINENFEELGPVIEGQLTTDELAAIQGASTPSNENPFATISDLNAEGVLSTDQVAAVAGANSPSASNVFLTQNDISIPSNLKRTLYQLSFGSGGSYSDPKGNNDIQTTGSITYDSDAHQYLIHFINATDGDYIVCQHTNTSVLLGKDATYNYYATFLPANIVLESVCDMAVVFEKVTFAGVVSEFEITTPIQLFVEFFNLVGYDL